jgi:hypothetical protein
MRTPGSRPERHSRLRSTSLVLSFAVFGGLSAHILCAQTTNQETTSEQIQRLTDSMARAQAQLDEMRQQLLALQRQVEQTGATVTAPEPSAVTPAASPSVTESAPLYTAAAIDDLREQQAIQEAQIATHEQSKVESESEYPVKINGLVLLNGFVNTRQVDMAATPTVAVPGPGSTGASLRQTVLGVNARGPHLFGARSYGDLSVDFNGNPRPGTSVANYTGSYGGTTTLLRLRTAHAGLQWQRTDAYFSLDRPIISPEAPTSLTAVAEPALAWSGNLWTWNPQVGVTRDLAFARSRMVRLQGALIDVGDAPLSPAAATGIAPTAAEQSRWPGAEARIALIGSKPEGSHLGVGGYFAPHLSSLVGRRFDAWAGTLDAKLLLPARMEFSGSFYRGEALGGLGGGGYKDFAYRVDTDTGGYYFRPLDDVGGWAQLKEKISERLEVNAAFGLDNVFAREFRRYAVPGGTMYQNLARNRTYTGNVIYSPSAYLVFSLEYRNLGSSPIVGLPAGSNVIGIAAGYKF